MSKHALDSAIRALQMQRPDQAEKIITDILTSDRGNVLALQILGHALLMQNRAAEAVAPLEKAAQGNDNPAVETLLATALAGARQPDKALDQLRRTTARRPPFPPAFLELSSQLSKIGRLDEATAVLESGLALAPGAINLRLELGFHLLKRNKRAEARALFSQVLSGTPQRHDALLALAKVMALDGDYAAAADTYRRALAMHPSDVVTRNNLGICLLEMGERDAGENSLRVAVRDVPQVAGLAVTSLAAASHGRFFLRPSAATSFLRSEKS